MYLLTPNLALYGKPYLAAAKDTWGLFKDRGIDTVINDSLVSMGKLMYFAFNNVAGELICCFYSADMGRLCCWIALRSFRFPVFAL